MRFLQNISLAMVVPVLTAVLSVVTPDLRNKLHAFAIDWHLSSKQTDNPYDDIAAAFLLAMLDLPTPTTASDLSGKIDPTLVQ